VTSVAYDLHSVGLRVESTSREVHDAVNRRLRHFRAPASGVGCPDLRLEIGVGTEAPPFLGLAGAARPVYDTLEGPVLYHEESDTLALDYGGKARLLVHASTGQGRLWAAGAGADAVWLVTHLLLTLALVELLKRHGRYGLHAAGVSPVPGTVVLLAGQSGAGKTTLSLALTAAGWGFLADDTVFLDPTTGPTTVLAFPDEIDVTDETLALLPHLAVPPESGRPKRQLRFEDTAPGHPERRGRAVVVVFPAVADQPESTLRPMAPSDALAALAPNVLLTDPASSQRHLNALAALVGAVPAWSLETGRDFPTLAAQLGRVAAGTEA
jgi:hypothetical protein